MKYKIGDRVRIREDLEVDCVYGDFGCFIQGMNKHKGKVAKIISIVNYAFDNCYKIDLDGGIYMWTDKMLESVELNKEHFKSEILDIVTSHNVSFGVNIETEVPCECYGLKNTSHCKNCLFYSKGSCIVQREAWSNEEYIGPFKATKLTQVEFDLLRTMPDKKIKFESDERNMKMYHQGYFKGIYDIHRVVEDILENYMIVNDVYE